MCKNLDGENWRIFGQSSITPNFSGTKVSLHTVNGIQNMKNTLHTYVIVYMLQYLHVDVCNYGV